MKGLSSRARSLAINSALCSRVVTYRDMFMPQTIGFPSKGICFNHESFQAGGNVDCATKLFWEEAFVGILRSEDSGVRSAGQSRDHSTLFGGKLFSRRKF